ncbi:universal stress protein [Thermoplasma sp. Kam2015]|uniref:universal stress protein n=1 Tax=Thermoplasma sp. Kam2015 TaxID=2094122 RepID=UPI000D9CE3E6|nr:universal stress protein [Thermoplasma sp. Kam2015]PYB68587.1 universal stress protein [Thermoplasma sp. Kam2015]
MKALIAYDGSETAQCALEFALNLKNSINKFLVVYVIPQIIGTTPTYDTYVPESMFEDERRKAEEIIEKAKKLVSNENLDIEFEIVDSGTKTVAKKMVEVAEENGVDLIITGSRNLKGLTKIILGSVSSELLKLSTVPVMICSTNACK